MPNILVIGATGYIGQALALHLLRSGHHTVYGIARSESKARSLAALEIVPVISTDPSSEPAAFLDAISKHRIDSIVITGADETAHALLQVIVEAGKQRQQEYAQAGLTSGPKLGVVYTSGTWVHGSSTKPVTDLEPVGTSMAANKPAQLVAWRAEFEKEVLSAQTRSVVDTVVVRPALVYGRSHAIWTMFFKPVLDAAKSGAASVQIPLDAESRPALIHVDDTASGLTAAVEKLPEICGSGIHPVFDLSGQTEAMIDVFASLASAVGYKGKVELVGAGDNTFAAAMSTSCNNKCERAKMVLGWSPKREPLVDGMEIYAKAFEASV